jgi:hypothetical protein
MICDVAPIYLDCDNAHTVEAFLRTTAFNLNGGLVKINKFKNATIEDIYNQEKLRNETKEKWKNQNTIQSLFTNAQAIQNQLNQMANTIQTYQMQLNATIQLMLQIDINLRK